MIKVEKKMRSNNLLFLIMISGLYIGCAILNIIQTILLKLENKKYIILLEREQKRS